jgi:hypothetical protein
VLFSLSLGSLVGLGDFFLSNPSKENDLQISVTFIRHSDCSRTKYLLPKVEVSVVSHVFFTAPVYRTLRTTLMMIVGNTGRRATYT